MAKSRYLFSQKSSVVDVRLGSKYASDILPFRKGITFENTPDLSVSLYIKSIKRQCCPQTLYIDYWSYLSID